MKISFFKYFLFLLLLSGAGVTVSSQVITTIAGSGIDTDSGDGSPATLSEIRSMAGLTFDGIGRLYIGSDDTRVRRIDTSGIINTVAGSGAYGFSGDGAPATAATLRNPVDVCTDGMGNIYVADYSNHRVRKIDAVGTISTFAGTGTSGYSGDGGPASVALLSFPRGVAADASGNIYIAQTI